jgi:uncharacterized protein (TIGR00730 family)
LPYPYPELPREEVEALGIKTSYVVAGRPDRPLVLLLHGMSSSGDTFREVMHDLADDFWLIAPDLPGFGQSEDTEPYTLSHLVEWLAAFHEALRLPQMRLAGHSFGGALATSYTASYPGDVSRLLLIAPAVLAADMFPDFVKRAGISLGLVDLGASFSQSRAMVEQSGRSFYDPDRIDDSVWERRLRDLEQSRAAGGVLKALAFQDLEPALRRLKQPVRVVWGQDDPVLPAAQAKRVGELLGDPSQVIVWDQCGHIPFLEKQEQFLDLSRVFFRGEEQSEASVTASRAHRVISVFGGSTPEPGSTAYDEAYQVGRLLAEQGFAVATGGYCGTMTAVSQGAAEAGGHVIGVTSDQIERFRPLAPNEWLKEEIRFPTLQERLIHLVRQNDGMIVLPGGIGTLSEMALAWSYIQVGEISPRPLALLGTSWRDTLTTFSDPQYVRSQHIELLHFADTPQDAVNHVAVHALRPG